MTVYRSMILPYFEYGDVIYMVVEGAKLNKLQRIQTA